MITYKSGDIFTSNCQALVNPVNCVGVMGRGLALEFKEKYPENFRVYKTICGRGKMKIGRMLSIIDGGRIIVNFPTKLHWRQKSKLAYIEQGLDDLVSRTITLFSIRSIAVPALGCGLGGLDWTEVKPLLDEKLVRLNSVNVEVYEPR